MSAQKNSKSFLITDFHSAEQSVQTTSNSVKKFLAKYSKTVGVILIVGVVTLTAIILITAKHENASQKDLAAVVSAVSKLIILPTNEQPTLATVEDKTKLKDKFLASKAENGDRVLIYSRNQMIIIYRPSINKIVGVGSVIDNAAVSEANGATLTVLDGSNNPEKKQEIINEVKTAYPNLIVIDGGESSRQDLPNTIVIDNTNQKDELLLALVSVISGKRGIVPLGIVKSPTDLMIIVGKD